MSALEGDFQGKGPLVPVIELLLPEDSFFNAEPLGSAFFSGSFVGFRPFNKLSCFDFHRVGLAHVTPVPFRHEVVVW